ncbi:hypothetical protein [Nocardioides acrostichi]|uniref:Uncharacterized protein n=1 Tax=Nocardioides acrostichi TaxID=2784339 RepID=A0A930V0W1_9ACTN|nr:hypothetical protein [Nocardioides acrostichi]MBF4163661.1 hypothetical protein [Nocardioides acrostichi]
MAPVPLAIGPGRDQLRFTTPLPDRLGVHSSFGDVLLTLTRGLSGKQEDHIHTARSFGLSRIGDQALIRGTHPASISAAYSISHLLAITYLPVEYSFSPTRARPAHGRKVPGTDWYLPREQAGVVRPATKGEQRAAIAGDSLPPGARTVGGGLVNSQKLRPEFGMDGGYYEFANEEYFHIEVDDDGAVVLWSSDLTADAAVSIVEKFLGHPTVDCHGFLVSTSGVGVDEASPRVIDQVKKDPGKFRMLSIGFDDCIVTWRRAQKKMATHKVPHIELSYSARDVNTKILLELMRGTGSENVRSALAKGGWDLIQSLVGPGPARERAKR